MPAIIAKYGVSRTFYFALESPAATSSDRFVNTAGIFVAGDCTRSLDGAALANTANLAVQVSSQLYGITLTAAEMEADIVNVFIIDQNGPVWRDLIIQIETRIDLGITNLRTKKAAAGAAGTITLDAAASAVDDFYNELGIAVIGGTGAGQIRMITDYVGATKVATINRNWSTNPDNTSIFSIFNGADVWDQLEGSEITNALIIAAQGSKTFRTIFQALFKRFYNLITQTVTQQKVLKDDGVTTIATMAVADDGVTQSKGVRT